MIKAIGVLFVATIIFFLDFRSIRNMKSKRDNKVYIVTFLLALCLFILFAFDVNFPYPLNWIKQLYQPIVAPFNKILEQSRIG